MANTSVARGLLPRRYASGESYNGAANVYYVPATDATALYIGDGVKPVTASAEANGVPTVTRAAAGDTLLGAVVGVITAGRPPITITRDLPIYRPASTAMYILVADDPEIEFEIQENGTMGIGAGGRNANLVVASGSTVTGYSGSQIASSGLATTNTLQLRILRPIDREDNDPTSANAKWLVRINLHAWRTTTGV